MGKVKTPEYTILDKITWDVSMSRADLEEGAIQAKYEDKVLEHFARNIYPPIAVLLCPMPGLEELYAYSPNALDALYLTVRAKMPAWFDDTPFTEESITFSDGKTITVQSKRPSVILRLVALEAEAERGETLENMRREIFRSVYYPKLAGCSVGAVPEESYARSIMGMEDLQLWYDAAKRQIPDWFATLEEIAAQNQALEKEKKRMEG